MSQPPSFDDAHVLLQIRTGNAEIFSRLFHAYYPACFRFALSFTQECDRAEDMVQDVFGWLWLNRATWDPRGDILAYLLASVRNRALVTTRNERRRTDLTTRFVAPGESPAMASPYRQADIDAEIADLSNSVWRFIQAMPEQRRTVLLLRWRHGLEWDAVGQIMGISLPAARMAHSRALDELRKHFSEEPL